jgi:hypothetical protein
MEREQGDQLERREELTPKSRLRLLQVLPEDKSQEAKLGADRALLQAQLEVRALSRSRSLARL